MDTPESLKGILRLGHRLRFIVDVLEDCDCVDEDQSWVGKSPPPDPLPRGAGFAIANVRSLDDAIHEADALAKDLPADELRRQVRETLILAHDTICQADVPAEMAAIDGNEEEAIDICRTALANAYEECGVALKRLSAAVLVVGSEACDSRNRERADEAQEVPPRPAYGRDHRFLAWESEGYGPAAIRDKWNALSQADRKRICPSHWEEIGGGDAGREVVKSGLKKAREEAKN